ncbi:cobalamin biosynthesis protein [Nocardia cyriacigeorgica]|uniref:Cobalamin biosynthesis protein CobD n=1 Tax=Nocardia cyriacigeorgica TaxID=135487 RepID=A0ABX0CKD7_9NOCA|nr:cobalamin biosynthesis protein [Nocardia cyriacigeorgica]NEW40102.1 cobalamin biosynthesis protein [Nocardia cyriacigeorgica]NEW56619.1 cobalamin biosynthesis protein [Nocardia cyriacigeorgica]
MRSATSRAAGLVLGFGLDRVFGDPRRWHPVAGFGSAALALESLTYADRRVAGVVHEAVLVGAVIGAGAVLGRGGTVATALATWTALGGRSLARTGREMAGQLESGDIAGARALLPSLCGRDPEALDADGLARAALESIAENTSDATVAPLFWGAVAGVPGLLGYRAINTLDAMIGYRNDRYHRFGWAAARTDDIANLVPARLTGLLTVLLAPSTGGRASRSWRAWRRDAAKHPSPNAGVVEASMAGALDIRLGGTTRYRHGIEERPTLGDGPEPTVPDLRRAVRMSEAVQLAAVAVLAGCVSMVALRR